MVTLAAPGTRLDRLVDHGLVEVGRDVTVAVQAALARGLNALEGISLPPITGGTEDLAHLRELAPLYFVAELDRAGLLGAAEQIAVMVATGEVHGSFEGGAAALESLWRGRHRRFAPEERAALFHRLFGAAGPAVAGAGSNDRFEHGLATLADAVIGHTDDAGGWDLGDQVRLRTVATEFVVGAAQHQRGLPRLASRELVDQVRTSLAVVRDPGVQAAFGQRTSWGVVAAVSGVAPQRIVAHVRRARAGAQLLSWAAVAASRSQDQPPPEVASAAFEWLEATVAGPLA